jgi:hypothetical protein
MSSFLLMGMLLLELGLYDSSSEVSVLFHDKRFVIELTVEPVLRGSGGGSGSEDELLVDSSDWDEAIRPGTYDLTSGRALYAAETF